MTRQLKFWQGKFGKTYTDRNVVDWRIRVPAFKRMLDGLMIKRVLEVGCNRGHNLLTLTEVLGEECEVMGIEPNRYALELARASSLKIDVFYGNVFDLPFKNEYFDLVFTTGVLIHISLADLSGALNEIFRVSKRYILAIEYFAEEEMVIPYRGRDDLLWKRDFLKQYRTQFADLVLIRDGYWGPENGFDRAHWWLLEKAVSLEKK